ncbi:MAG: hypothetical protein M1826_002327 [Phylliscum demangeonii]|nr:MAG: hypothetical protein M1826_002327 [Phylliscum demangeonii]
MPPEHARPTPTGRDPRPELLCITQSRRPSPARHIPSLDPAMRTWGPQAWRSIDASDAIDTIPDRVLAPVQSSTMHRPICHAALAAPDAERRRDGEAAAAGDSAPEIVSMQDGSEPTSTSTRSTAGLTRSARPTSITRRPRRGITCHAREGPP